MKPKKFQKSIQLKKQTKEPIIKTTHQLKYNNDNRDVKFYI